MWDTLPRAIFEECLAFLRARDVVKASITCKDWQNIVLSSKDLIKNTIFDQRFSKYARREMRPRDLVVDKYGIIPRDIIELPFHNAVAIHYHKMMDDDYIYICDKESGQHIDTIKFENELTIGRSEDKKSLIVTEEDVDCLGFSPTVISFNPNGTFNKSNKIGPILQGYEICSVAATNEHIFVGVCGNVIVFPLSNPLSQEREENGSLYHPEACQEEEEEEENEELQVVQEIHVGTKDVNHLTVWKNILYFTVGNWDNTRHYNDYTFKIYDLNDGLLTNLADNVSAFAIANPEHQDPLFYSLHEEHVKVWSISGECLQEINIGEGFCYGLAVSYADWRFFTFQEKAWIKLWTMDGKLLECFPYGEKGNITSKIMCSESGHLYAIPHINEHYWYPTGENINRVMIW